MLIGKQTNKTSGWDKSEHRMSGGWMMSTYKHASWIMKVSKVYILICIYKDRHIAGIHVNEYMYLYRQKIIFKFFHAQRHTHTHLSIYLYIYIYIYIYIERERERERRIYLEEYNYWFIQFTNGLKIYQASKWSQDHIYKMDSHFDHSIC